MIIRSIYLEGKNQRIKRVVNINKEVLARLQIKVEMKKENQTIATALHEVHHTLEFTKKKSFSKNIIICWKEEVIHKLISYSKEIL